MVKIKLEDVKMFVVRNETFNIHVAFAALPFWFSLAAWSLAAVLFSGQRCIHADKLNS